MELARTARWIVPTWNKLDGVYPLGTSCNDLLIQHIFYCFICSMIPESFRVLQWTAVNPRGTVEHSFQKRTWVLYIQDDVESCSTHARNLFLFRTLPLRSPMTHPISHNAALDTASISLNPSWNFRLHMHGIFRNALLVHVNISTCILVYFLFFQLPADQTHRSFSKVSSTPSMTSYVFFHYLLFFVSLVDSMVG